MTDYLISAYVQFISRVKISFKEMIALEENNNDIHNCGTTITDIIYLKCDLF